MKKYLYSDLTEKIIGLCIEVHKAIGPGFPEKVYHNALKILFPKSDFEYDSEKKFNVIYLNEIVGKFRVDFVLNKKVILEIKAITGNLPEVFKAQVISYLKASDLEVGILVNFGNDKLNVKRLARYKDYQKELKNEK
ncbi:MAG: GxxExxY protein [Candidatus Cloacimonetes bacterium]|nr:GxxExxY protein [Candidatus Cloacimonadota bacterium]